MVPSVTLTRIAHPADMGRRYEQVRSKPNQRGGFLRWKLSLIALSIALMYSGLEPPATSREQGLEKNEMKPDHVLKGFDGAIRVMSYSPDGSSLAVVDDSRAIKIFNTTTGDRFLQLQDPTESINALAYDPTGHLLASGSQGGRVRVWDVTDGKVRHEIRAPSRCYSLAFSPDAKNIAVGCWGRNEHDGGRFHGIQISSLGRLDSKRIPVPDTPIVYLRYSPAGTDLAAGSQHLYVIIIPVYKVKKFVGADTRGLTGIEFVQDRRLVAAACLDHRIRVWDIQNCEKCKYIIHEDTNNGCYDRILAMSHNPVNETVATFSADACVRYWDMGKTVLLSKVSLSKPLKTQFIWKAAFSPNGKRLAVVDPQNQVFLFGGKSLP